MKIGNKSRTTLAEMIDVIIIGAWMLFLFTKFGPWIAILSGCGAFICGYMAARFIVWSKRRREQKLIHAQCNASERLYISQRLAMLPYGSAKKYTTHEEVYSLQDPIDTESCLFVLRFPSQGTEKQYMIILSSRKYLGATDIGNRYERLTETFVLATDRAEIPYARQAVIYNSDPSQGVEREDNISHNLQQMPDDVLDSIEHALIAWEPMPVND